MRLVSKLSMSCVVLILAACGDAGSSLPMPREPGPQSKGFYCRMNLAEHGGPKGQILPVGWTDPLWFSSVRDALMYVSQDIVSEREIAAFWVNDMELGAWEKPAPGSWISAHAAWYVVGSNKASGMGGGEAVPFRRRQAADGFAGEFGGRVVDYAGARETITEAPVEIQAEASGL